MLTTFYLFLSFVLILSLLFRKRTPFVDARFMVEAGLLVYYAFPGIRFSTPEWFDYKPIYTRYYGYEQSTTFASFLCVIAYYCFYLLGYSKLIRLKTNNRNRKFDCSKALFIQDERSFAVRTAWIIGIVSFVLFIIYATLFGGIQTVLLNIANIREGTLSTRTGTFDFINKLFRCAPFALYLIVNYRKHIVKSNLFVIGAIAFIITLSYGGRGILMILLLTLLLGDYYYKKEYLKQKYNYIKLVRIVAIVIFCLVLYRPLLTAMNSFQQGGLKAVADQFVFTLSRSNRYNASSLKGILSSLYQSTDHYIISLDTAIANIMDGKYSRRFLMEPIIAVTSIIPSKLLGITKPVSITETNSTFITGVFGAAQIPAGIVGEAYYGGGILFVVLYGLILGQIGRRIDHQYSCMKGTIAFSSAYYIGILFTYFAFAIGGDFSSNFAKNMTTLFVIAYVNFHMRHDSDIYDEREMIAR